MSEPGRQLLLCLVGGARYALDIADVRELLPVPHLTRVPGAPDFVRGVGHVRGEMLPVLDLSVCLGGAPRPLTRFSCLLVLCLPAGAELLSFALLVDEVERAVSYSGTLGPAPAGRAEPADLLRGVWSDEDGALLVLEPYFLIDPLLDAAP